MSDLISRQDAIDAVSEAWKCGAYYIETINAIKDLPSAQPEPQWIPCSERLPEEGEDVLIQFKEGQDCPYKKFQVGHLGAHDVEDLHFKKIGVKSVWYAENGYFDFDKVVAWMTLPEPWKGAER